MSEFFHTAANGCLFGDVGGFYEKYFTNKPWSPEADSFAQAVSQSFPDSRGIGQAFPTTGLRRAVLGWFEQFLPTFRKGREAALTIALGGPGSERDYSNSVFFIPQGASSPTWAAIQVVGEVVREDGNVAKGYCDGLVRLTGHATAVFKAQPTRRFLHGFLVYGSAVELWVFDRVRFYCCKPLDLKSEPRRFLAALAAYALLGDNERGLDTFIQVDDMGSRCVLIEEQDDTACSKPRGQKAKSYTKLCLQEPAIASTRQILYSGPTCYRARKSTSDRYDLVVKLAWRETTTRPEEVLLTIARDRKVWGVNRLYGLKEIDSSARLHSGLRFGTPRRWCAQAAAAGAGPGGVDSPGLMRLTTEASRSQAASSPVDDWVLSCVVVSPYGRPLDQFATLVELLEALRDAVRAHRSLYLDGQILHQDVSIGNIIITADVGGDGNGTPGEDGPKGMLIDLDLSLDLGSGTTNPPFLIGTRPFMAVGLLEGKPHTYRHDMESVLYVLLWAAICRQADMPPEGSCLSRWMKPGARFVDLARTKYGDMEEQAFANVTAEIPAGELEGVRALAENLRRVLFVRQGQDGLFTGTDLDLAATEDLYRGMIGGFETAIAAAKGEDQVKR